MAISRRSGSARSLTVALAGVLLTAACAAGQHAATSEIRPGIDGTQGRAGSILLEGVAIHAPSGSSYTKGGTAQLGVTLVNDGTKADTLVGISGSDFTGWGIVSNADADSTTTPTGATNGRTIEPGTAERLGVVGLGGSADASEETIVLTSLASTLYPGDTVPIAFRFAAGGTVTLNVPVQLTSEPNGATIAPVSGADDEG